MPVYVDEAKHRFRRMIMCHMTADTLEELHAMADAIGIRRKWFQRQSTYPHYDICKQKRGQAVRRGAIEVTSRELVQKAKTLNGGCMSEKPGFVFEPLSEQYWKVKPCPFCGGRDIARLEEHEACVLYCENCGAQGPNWDYHEERSIRTWNSRSSAGTDGD